MFTKMSIPESQKVFKKVNLCSNDPPRQEEMNAPIAQYSAFHNTLQGKNPSS